MGYLEIVKYIVEYLEDKNPAINDGWTALHIAAQEGHMKVVIYLEEYLVMIAQLFQNLFKVVVAYALEKLYRYCAIVERGKQIS